MKAMQWSWRDLQDTPDYVVRYCMDLLSIQRQAEAREHERHRLKMEREAQRGA